MCITVEKSPELKDVHFDQIHHDYHFSKPEHGTIKCVTDYDCEECQEAKDSFHEMSKNWTCGCGVAYHCSMPHCNNSISSGGSNCCEARSRAMKYRIQNELRELNMHDEDYEWLHKLGKYQNTEYEGELPTELEMLHEAVEFLKAKYGPNLKLGPGYVTASFNIMV